MADVEHPLENFQYLTKDILTELYKESELTAPLGTTDFLNLPVTDAYLNNPERIARVEKEKREREEWERQAESQNEKKDTVIVDDKHQSKQ
jgi:hypothetical protein